MKKVIVIGCPGSGKTTFCAKLQKITNLPLYSLDSIWHKADRKHISREEFDVKLSEILEKDKWLIDGNYSRTLEIRIKNCDTIFFFDLPTKVCLQGAIARLGKVRPDMPWVDTELDPNFKKEIDEFKIQITPTIYDLIDKYKENKTVVIFYSRDNADEYINSYLKL